MGEKGEDGERGRREGRVGIKKGSGDGRGRGKTERIGERGERGKGEREEGTGERRDEERGEEREGRRPLISPATSTCLGHHATVPTFSMASMLSLLIPLLKYCSLAMAHDLRSCAVRAARCSSPGPTSLVSLRICSICLHNTCTLLHYYITYMYITCTGRTLLHCHTLLCHYIHVQLEH